MSGERNRYEKIASLRRFWEAKKGDHRCPLRDEIDPVELQEWYPNLIHVDVVDGGRDYVVTLYGQNLVDLMDVDVTGKRLSEIRGKYMRLTRAEYARVVRTAEPLYLVRDHGVCEDGPPVRVARLALPISSDGEQVDGLLVAVYPEPVESLAQTVAG